MMDQNMMRLYQYDGVNFQSFSFISEDSTNCCGLYSDDMAKNSHLKDLQALGPLKVFRADMDEEGSFDDAIAGCDYAFLVAAPMNFNSENPEVNS